MRISDWSSDVCSSDLPFGRRAVGDSNYIFSGGKPTLSLERDKGPGKYTGQVDMGNRANYPVEAPDIQRQFPASLLMSGTRDLGLSRTVLDRKSTRLNSSH